MTHLKKAQRALSSRALLADTRGGIIIIFALILVPLLVIVAMSIDTTRINALKRHVQTAVDSAALAAAREYENPGVAATVLQAAATDSFDGNIATRQGDVTCAPLTVTTNAATERVAVEAQCTVPAFIGVGLTGRASHTVSATATAEGPVARLDLALLLDVSDSMMNPATKLGALKTSATSLINTIITPDTGTRVRVSLVPYGQGVNAGVYGNKALGRADNDDIDLDGVDKVCVAERIGASAFTSAGPTIGRYSEPMSIGTCPSNDNLVLPLTATSSTITNAIAGLDPVGGGTSFTSGHVAIAWGWYSISPNWGGIWPAASNPLPMNTVRNRKVMVIMSDGAFGFPLDATAGLAYEQAIKLCEKARDEGVEIFTIGFDMASLLNPTARDQADQTMEDCATSPNHYFSADDATELQQAFDDIGRLLFLGTAITN